MFLVEQVFLGRDENRASLKRLRGRLLFLETEKRTFFLNPPPPPPPQLLHNRCRQLVLGIRIVQSEIEDIGYDFFYGGGGGGGGGCD